MRWKEQKEPPTPNGEIRFEAKFAWRPVRIRDQWVWLERYWKSAHWYVSCEGDWLCSDIRFHLWEHKAR